MFKHWSLCRHQGHPLHCIIHLELSLFVIKNIICKNKKNKKKQKRRVVGESFESGSWEGKFFKTVHQSKMYLGFSKCGIAITPI